MSKRLHDTEVWKKQWFRELTPAGKCLWIYIKDTCDCAGIYEHDQALCEFMIGSKIPDISILGKHLHHIKDNRYFLVDFVEFQYGYPLNELSPVHKKVINILKKHEINFNTLSNRVLNTLCHRGKEKDKDKEEEKEKEKDRKGIVKGKDNKTLPDFLNPELWQGYVAMRHKIRKPITPHGQELAIKKLTAWHKAGHNITEIIENSIINSYQGLFIPKDKPVTSNSTHSGKPDPKHILR